MIPEIVSVVLAHRPKNSVPYFIPNSCPCCGEIAEKAEGEVILRCINPSCPSIVKEALKHFISRRAMNMDGVGDRLIESLVDSGLVTIFSDLFLLNKESLLTLERQGDKSVENILSSIEKSKKTTLARFIYSLGIRFVGEQTAKLLAQHFQNMDSFLSATEEELLSIPEIGPKVAQSILTWIQSPKMKNEVLKLFSVGVSVKNSALKITGVLNQKTFLITGTLPVKRDEAKDYIEAQGGRLLSSVSRKLDYLVVGEDPGSKVEKAQALGVQIITWEDLKAMTDRTTESNSTKN